MKLVNVQFCATLSEWKDGYMERSKDLKRKNGVLCVGVSTWCIVINTGNRAKEIANKQGFNLRDLLGETSYGALHHLRNRSFQNITWSGQCWITVLVRSGCESKGVNSVQTSVVKYI